MAASIYAQMQDIRTCTDINCLLQYIGDYITCKISGGNIMNRETIDRIDVIAKNLNSLADQVRTLNETNDVSASLPVIVATLKMQSANLSRIYEELAGKAEE